MNQSLLEKKEEKIKDTPWTNFNIKMDLCSFLTRKVLVEKYNKQKSKEIEMRNFFLTKIDGCELFLNSDYPDYIFYVKNKEILMERYEKNKTFYIKYIGIWSVFDRQYMLQYDEIQSFTQILIEECLKSNGYRTNIDSYTQCSSREDCLESNGYKTIMEAFQHPLCLEDGIESNGYKTRGFAYGNIIALEDSLKSNG